MFLEKNDFCVKNTSKTSAQTIKLSLINMLILNTLFSIIERWSSNTNVVSEKTDHIAMKFALKV